MKNPGQIAVTALRILDARVFPEKGLGNPVWNMDAQHLSPLFLDRYTENWTKIVTLTCF